MLTTNRVVAILTITGLVALVSRSAFPAIMTLGTCCIRVVAERDTPFRLRDDWFVFTLTGALMLATWFVGFRLHRFR